VPQATPTPLPPGVTPPPATATPVPQATATPAPTTGLRDRSQWTVENPATLAEIEAALEQFRGDNFVFVSWGGAYGGAQRQAFIIPFQDKFGIEIIEDTIPSAAKIRAMAETGNVTWHVFDTGGVTIFQLGETGDLEELDFSIIDNRDFLEVTRTPWSAGGGITWSEVWAYSTETYPDGGPQPKTMADIYDTDKFPGRRGWTYYPEPDMKFVLLADDPSLLDTPQGRASLSSLTPEQEDRAFELFDQYRDQVTLIWATGSDCPQLLLSGELDMCTAWNGRIFDAQQEGASLKVCWECGHVINTDSWAIPRGLKEQDPDKFYLSQLFIAWTSFPEINAQISLYITYGPVNTRSLPVLEGSEFDAVRDELPSSAANIPFAVIQDELLAGQRADVLFERYTAFLQSLD
ncbi:MAG: extracellular solute-binding protein, partial [Dehalococcoidia bacterium]